MAIASKTNVTPRQKRALSLARERLRSLRLEEIARRAGVRCWRENEKREFCETFCLNRSYRVSYPEGHVERIEGTEPLNHVRTLLILHYLIHADGHRMADRWVAFRELPNGLMYDAAFRGRVEPPLVAAYGTRMDRFQSAGRAMGGHPIAFGDCAFMFDVLPRVRMAVILHQGDEELAPAARVLFDGSAGHYLPTEDLAILGGMLVGALLRATPHG